MKWEISKEALQWLKEGRCSAVQCKKTGERVTLEMLKAEEKEEPKPKKKLKNEETL